MSYGCSPLHKNEKINTGVEQTLFIDEISPKKKSSEFKNQVTLEDFNHPSDRKKKLPDFLYLVFRV
jgi:hypothetical protein